jgi:hypothetical protein
MRDRVEAALLDLGNWDHAELRIRNEHQRRVVAGIIRKAFAPQLEAARHDAETLDRVRKLVRRHRHDETIPKRALEAALYGDEER